MAPKRKHDSEPEQQVPKKRRRLSVGSASYRSRVRANPNYQPRRTRAQAALREGSPFMILDDNNVATLVQQQVPDQIPYRPVEHTIEHHMDEDSPRSGHPTPPATPGEPRDFSRGDAPSPESRIPDSPRSSGSNAMDEDVYEHVDDAANGDSPDNNNTAGLPPPLEPESMFNQDFSFEPRPGVDNSPTPIAESPRSVIFKSESSRNHTSESSSREPSDDIDEDSIMMIDSPDQTPNPPSQSPGHGEQQDNNNSGSSPEHWFIPESSPRLSDIPQYPGPPAAAPEPHQDNHRDNTPQQYLGSWVPDQEQDSPERNSDGLARSDTSGALDPTDSSDGVANRYVPDGSPHSSNYGLGSPDYSSGDYEYPSILLRTGIGQGLANTAMGGAPGDGVEDEGPEEVEDQGEGEVEDLGQDGVEDQAQEDSEMDYDADGESEGA
ncbi:uncharacterized protein B0H64DRAFT_463394 [Chaetomium fimeti]|uniref:Uncharacterized protein n=1 Tax=Chaetomium fimeti TaxID=1854472 RepID=A0AAE0HDJ1_9PEZI|nr:hypothetical protein B0H64DRAFT_463394 [Chaetomium fimeti]